jgi:hypothetical protein
MNNKQIKRQLWATAGLGLVVLVLGAVALYNYFDNILRSYFFT